LGSHAWREPQWAALEEQLQQINLLSPVKQAVETERVSMCHVLESIPPSRVMKLTFSSLGKLNSWEELEILFLAELTPRGWMCQDLVRHANFYPDVLASLDPARQIIFPEKLHAVPFHPSLDTSLAIMLLPNFSKAIQTTARNQTMVNQALIACALERYRLAHGEYPESLGALAPQFITAIPHDFIGGQPPHYRRASGGTFTLYSIGWNGRDNGGARGQSNTDGDWIWADFTW
jgi:hypothetical protein